MSRYNKSNNRNQLSFEPLCLDDMLPDDAEVRALEVIVDKMDVRTLGFEYSETKRTGRMPYDPVDMFKIYIYSYFNGIRSSRKIERECYRNIELIWLIGDIRPDFKTIADFRKNNKKQIKQAFQKFSLICDELGLIGKEIVAIDGSKFRASNGRNAYYTEKKTDEKIKAHQRSYEKYMKLLDTCDNDEADQPKLSKQEIVDKINSINKRINELEAIKKDVIKNGSIYETDSDSRMMRTANNGSDICYNVQIAVDDKNHLVVAVDSVSEPIDKEQLHNMASQAKENMRVEKLNAIADRGYYSAKQFKMCVDDSITAFVPKAIAAQAATLEFDKEEFIYDEEKGGYICPVGALLSPYSGGTLFTNRKACRECCCKEKCTTGKYRTINDRPFAEYSREVDKRTKGNTEIYKKRKELAEHPFGTVKRAFGFSYFLTRGVESVRVESCLHFLIYNMKRVINILGTQDLRIKLQG